MDHAEAKRKVLFHYHKNINFWWQLLGEFYEETETFTKPFSKRCTLDGIKTEITWANGSWDINEI